MGKSEGQDQWVRQDEGVQIIELGADQGDEPSPQRTDEPANPIRKRIVVGGLAAVVLLGGFAFLTMNRDAPLPEEGQTTTKRAPAIPNACDAIEEASQTGGSSNMHFLSGYRWYAAETPERTFSNIGLVHPDGSIQLCEESAQEASPNIQFPTEAELGKLPENLTYAYTSAHDPPNDGLLSLTLEGVRLPDGLVVESLTLADGLVVPANPYPAPSSG